eukprot:jgi/Chrzof1/2895/Cz12g03040.t1
MKGSFGFVRASLRSSHRPDPNGLTRRRTFLVAGNLGDPLQPCLCHKSGNTASFNAACYCPVACACFVAHAQPHCACPVPSEVDLPCLTSYNPSHYYYNL